MIVVKTNPYTFRDNGVAINLARLIVVVEKRKLANIGLDVSAPAVLSPPINDCSTRGDFERSLQTYSNVVTIIFERLKTRFCIIYNREYTLDVIRFGLSRERTVDLG